MRTPLQIIPGIAPPPAAVANYSSGLGHSGQDIGMGNAPVYAPPQADMKFNPAGVTPEGSSNSQSPTLKIIPGIAPPGPGIIQSQSNQGPLSTLTNIANKAAQGSQALLTGTLDAAQSMINTPKTLASLPISPEVSKWMGPNAITNFINPNVAKIIPSSNANIGNLLSTATQTKVANTPLNNALTRAGSVIPGAVGVADLLGSVGNWLNEIPSGLKLSSNADLPPVPGAPPEAVTTPVSPNYLTAVSADTSAQNSLNTLATNSQTTIPQIYQQELNNATSGMGSIGDYLTANRTLATNQAEQMMNAYQQYGDEIPEHLQPTSTPSLSTNRQQQLELTSAPSVPTPASATTNTQLVKNWLGDAFNTVERKAPIGFQKVISNPSIANNYDLQRELGEQAMLEKTNAAQTNLLGLKNKVLNEGVLNPLQELDNANNTNTAETVDQGLQLFKTNVIPFRANPTLDNMSSLDLTDPKRSIISPASAVKAISNAKLAGNIPQDHMLSSALPDFQNLAQYNATPGLSQITAGLGNLNPEQLTNQLNTAVNKGAVSASHPFGQLQQTMNSANAAKTLSEQNLSDQQALQNAQSQQNALTDQANLENYNALNKSNLQAYNTNMDNMNYNNALKTKQINALTRQKIKRILPAAGKLAVGLSGLHFLNKLGDFF